MADVMMERPEPYPGAPAEINLFPHQIEAIERWRANDRRLGLFIPPGTGKTLAALFAAFEVPGAADRILIVCEANKVKDWRIEGEAILGGQPDVISYNKFIKSDARRRSRWYNMIICDEAHALKNPAAQRTQAVRMFLQANGACEERPAGIPRMFLTGTPFTKDPLDTFNILKSLLIDVARMSQEEFESKYCVFKTWMQPWRTKDGRRRGEKQIRKLTGIRNIEDFNSRVDRHTFRKDKDEILPDLPPLLISRHRIELPVAEISSLKDYSEGATRGDAVRMLGMMKARHLAEHVGQFIDDYPEECPVLVAAHHVNVAEEFAARLRPRSSKKAPRRVALITGETDPLERDGLIRDAAAGKYDALVFTAATCGTGLNLQFSSRLYVLETCISPGLFVQLINRIHRIGQHRTARIEIATYSVYDAERLRSIEKSLRTMDEVIPAEAAA